MPSVVKRISADEARRLIEKNPDLFLLDVRQPEEYRKGHIPGAILLPLPELPDRLEELRSEKEIITYCRLGRRSLAAAQLIADELNLEVYTIDGGIMAWDGLVAKGDVISGLTLIEKLKSPEEILTFIYTLEDGSKRFYLLISESFEEPGTKEIFRILSSAEENHKKTIADVWPNVAVDEKFIDYIEGGVKFSETLISLEKKELKEILEYSMQLEVNSLDLYMRMVKIVPFHNKEILEKIIDEEKEHLRRLGIILSSTES